jgi:hypothetical protein
MGIGSEGRQRGEVAVSPLPHCALPRPLRPHALLALLVGGGASAVVGRGGIISDPATTQTERTTRRPHHWKGSIDLCMVVGKFLAEARSCERRNGRGGCQEVGSGPQSPYRPLHIAVVGARLQASENSLRVSSSLRDLICLRNQTKVVNSSKFYSSGMFTCSATVALARRGHKRSQYCYTDYTKIKIDCVILFLRNWAGMLNLVQYVSKLSRVARVQEARVRGWSRRWSQPASHTIFEMRPSPCAHVGLGLARSFQCKNALAFGQVRRRTLCFRKASLWSGKTHPSLLQ